MDYQDKRNKESKRNTAITFFVIACILAVVSVIVYFESSGTVERREYPSDLTVEQRDAVKLVVTSTFESVYDAWSNGADPDYSTVLDFIKNTHKKATEDQMEEGATITKEHRPPHPSWMVVGGFSAFFLLASILMLWASSDLYYARLSWWEARKDKFKVDDARQRKEFEAFKKYADKMYDLAENDIP